MVHRMVEAGITEEVNRSTDWCARGFFVEELGTDGKLCMVTDFQNLNQNLKRPVWPFSTTDRIRRSLTSKDRFFAKVDLVSGYHQIPIQESHRDLTCFLLPWGKYRYCVLPMGLSPSGDIFCHRTDKAVLGFPSICKQVDDCLASVKSVEVLEARLVGLLDRCSSKLESPWNSEVFLLMAPVGRCR